MNGRHAVLSVAKTAGSLGAAYTDAEIISAAAANHGFGTGHAAGNAKLVAAHVSHSTNAAIGQIVHGAVVKAAPFLTNIGAANAVAAIKTTAVVALGSATVAVAVIVVAVVVCWFMRKLLKKLRPALEGLAAVRTMKEAVL